MTGRVGGADAVERVGQVADALSPWFKDQGYGWEDELRDAAEAVVSAVGLAGGRCEVTDALNVAYDALLRTDEILRDRTPDLVEPQLEGMSDEEATFHGLYHQVLMPAIETVRAALKTAGGKAP